MSALKAAMKVDPFPCECCPEQHKDLLLIETRFSGRQCFVDLQCRNCSALWTAEIGPAPGSADLLPTGAEPQGWRVLSLTSHRAN